MSSLITACPYCDSARITNRVSGGWRCKECREFFDEAVHRPPKGHGSRQGVAYELEQMKPGDLDLEGNK